MSGSHDEVESSGKTLTDSSDNNGEGSASAGDENPNSDDGEGSSQGADGESGSIAEDLSREQSSNPENPLSLNGQEDGQQEAIVETITDDDFEDIRKKTLANYADLNQERYKQFLGERKDTDEERQKFADQEKEEAFKNEESKKEFQKNWRAAAGATHMQRNEKAGNNVREYANQNSEAYQKFLNGRKSSDTEMMKFLNEEKDNNAEFQKLFKKAIQAVNSRGSQTPKK